MLRRSRSSSQLPLPTSRTSSFGQSKIRSTSLARLSNRNKLSVEPSKQSLVTPILDPRGRSSYKKSSLFSLPTPSSSVKAKGKSPFKFNDKVWVSQQYAKVCNFLRQMPEFDANSLKTFTKPLTTNTFVNLVQIFMREIDCNVGAKITMATFKEVVPQQLRIMQYPGPLPNSLFKTVNTTHSWPQVISIFSWLVDFIVECNANEEFSHETALVLDYQAKLYQVFNSDENKDEVDRNFKESLANHLNLDPRELYEEKSNYNNHQNYIRKLNSDYNVCQDEIQQLSDGIQKKLDEIEAFESETLQRERALNEESSAISEEMAKLRENLVVTQACKSELLEVMKVQPCSSEEKHKLAAKIEEMRHTLILKTERRDKLKTMRDQFDYRLVDAKRKVKTEVYRLNNELMEPIVSCPQLEVLKLPVGGFSNKSFQNEISTRIEKKAVLLKSLRTKYEKVLNSIKKHQEEVDILLQNLEASQTALEQTKIVNFNSLKRLEEDLAKEESKLENRVSDCKNLKETIDEIVKSTPNNKALQQDIVLLTKNVESLSKFLNTYIIKVFDFLSKVKDLTFEKYEEMAAIFNDVQARLTAQTESIWDEQNQIFASLKELEIYMETPK